MRWLIDKIKSFFTRKRKIPNTSPRVISNVNRQERLIRLYQTMEPAYIGEQRASHVDWYFSKCIEGKGFYMRVSNMIPVPWEVVACIHGLEASFNWKLNLMNGQPYTRVTTWVPAGYGPWENWTDAAVDAFKLKKSQGVLPTEWTLGNTLEFLLRFNGLGYEKKGLVSPYLWSYTNHYTEQGGGKYVKDGVFDPRAISLQVGAALMLKKMGYKPE